MRIKDAPSLGGGSMRRARAILLLPAIGVGGAISVAGCGKAKAEQCKALIDAVEGADSVEASQMTQSIAAAVRPLLG